jgi:hypothetical protein
MAIFSLVVSACHVDDDCRSLLPKLLYRGKSGAERIVQDRLHEGAALHIEDSDSPLRGFQHETALPGGGGETSRSHNPDAIRQIHKRSGISRRRNRREEAIKLNPNLLA